MTPAEIDTALAKAESFFRAKLEQQPEFVDLACTIRVHAGRISLLDLSEKRKVKPS